MRLGVLLATSMPRLITVHLCALLLLCSSTSCLGTHYEDCLWNAFRCGRFNFDYPFGKNGSGCGDPHFQLDCAPDEQGSPPMLNIGGNEYRILNSSSLGNNDKNSLRIVHENIWVSNKDNRCNLTVNGNQSLWHDSQYFQLAADYTFVTFWKDCIEIPSLRVVLNSTECEAYYWHYSLGPELDPEGTRFCKTHFQLPIQNGYALSNILRRGLLWEGFDITWYEEPARNKSCSACLESNGSCGYNISEPKTFFCHCPEGTSYTRGKCLENGGPNKWAIIIGCSTGGVALTAIALLLFLKLYGKRRKQPPPSSISKVENFLRDYVYEMPTRYSQSDLKRMTNNFAEKLGEGGYGVVYKGKLPNGALVAVKLLDRHRQSEIQFMNEVATIGRVHHVNLVRLLGYCFESFTSALVYEYMVALVYEYMVNGSLEKFIFAGKQKGQILSREQLYSIALGAARGIVYLHQDCDKRIIHFDIKPHNILLDSEFTPKVSDFGLAKFCGKGDDHISVTGARGTPGYVAPELCERELGPVTDKSDVYSFGMLLLEIVGGRKNIDVQASRPSQLYFPEWAFKLLESGEVGMRLRVGGEMEVEDEEKARRVIKIGLWCIQYKSRDRPCMSRVVQMLEGNGDEVSSPPLPFNFSAEPERPLVSSSVTSSIKISL